MTNIRKEFLMEYVNNLINNNSMTWQDYVLVTGACDLAKDKSIEKIGSERDYTIDEALLICAGEYGEETFRYILTECGYFNQ